VLCGFLALLRGGLAGLLRTISCLCGGVANPIQRTAAVHIGSAIEGSAELAGGLAERGASLTAGVSVSA
jgi:hypothetical protein